MQHHGPNWQLVTAKPGWQARDSQGELVFNEELFILGGWYKAKLPNPRDVWKTANGKQWQCVTKEAPWIHADIPMVYDFKGRMWFMGGRKLPGKENSNSVWASANGKDWDLIQEEAAWSKRLGGGAVVFKNRMWLLGGTDNFYVNDNATMHNDVWSSADGQEWILECEHAPWSKRAFHQAVVFDDIMWVLGGGAWEPGHQVNNDVWFSEDGVNWQCATEHAAWEARIWFSAFAYRNHLWILGGWNKTHENFGDIWFSKDGRNWHEFVFDQQWHDRHEQSGLVFADKIYVCGGYADVLDSQVWSLELPSDWIPK